MAGILKDQVPQELYKTNEGFHQPDVACTISGRPMRLGD